MEKKIDTPNNDIEQLLSVHQFARQHKMNSMKKEGGGLSAKIQSAETSLGGLRQELGQVMQINTGASASRVSSQYGGISAWPVAPAGNSTAGSLAYQQQLQQQQGIDPLVQSLSRRFPSLTPRQHLDFSDAGSRRSSLGGRYLPVSNEPLPIQLESMAAVGSELHDKIAAAVQQQQQANADLAVDKPDSSSTQQQLDEVQQELQDLQQRQRQQESTFTIMLQDSSDQLLERLEGLHLRLQSVEEEQKGLLEREQQHSRKLDDLQQPASMVPSDAAEAEACLASPAAARSPSPFTSPQQQQQQQRPLLSPMQHRISQVADEVQFAALQAELKSVKRRLQDVEQAAADAAPLDGLQCGAVEARLAILEEDYAARHAGLDDAAGDAQGEQQQQRQGQVACADQLQADLGSLAARVAALEEQQQQMCLAAQSGEASAALLEMQPTVKNRIEQFEEQLNAAISRFAPGHASSSSRCGTPTAAEFRGSLSGSFTRDASRQELQQQLNTLQQEVAELQSRLDDLTDGSSQQQQHVQLQQLQELEQKLQQGSDQLAEQVLQLDLQLQMVEDKLRRQQQHSQAAVRAAEAAEASATANKQQLEQLQQQVQQAAEAAEVSSSTAELVEQLQADVQAALEAASAGGACWCAGDTEGSRGSA
ncbi:hypothetical protein OEZ85_000257 [Tetradesmus obliquus]|uniref:Uncharacterized protein n=1 Tax=Tetradesmus obliquus TaxID=3088 RepID=A0ABY8UQK1_TETOB|nr:hypothetical protein OEZ85_000257 [Tetradesmus obliquus]